MKITSQRVLATVAALCMLLVPGCDDAKKDAAKSDDKAAEAAAEVKKPAGVEKAAPAAEPEGVEVAAAPIKVGIPTCDDYIEKMTACFAGNGVPEDIRAAQKEGFEQTVRGWAETLKANPDAEGGLAAGCGASRDMAKRSYPKCFE